MYKNLIDKIQKEEIYKESFEIEKLSGDASSREYFRISRSGGSDVLCCDKPDSQQIDDFFKVTKSISESIKTPEILYYDKTFSMLIQTDVGDISLHDYVQNNDLKFHINAVKDIAKYQKLPTDTCMGRVFDKEKIEFEFDLATEFFVEKYLKIKLSPDDREVFKLLRAKLVDYFEANAEVVCHRDYHSKNLYVNNGDLVHIDYQDMRIGPRMYDFASLINDCYITFSEDQISELKKAFSLDFDKTYLDDFNIVSIQRIFKALGSFSYLHIDKNKSWYLEYIPTNLMKLIRLLEDMGFTDFANILKRSQND